MGRKLRPHQQGRQYAYSKKYTNFEIIQPLFMSVIIVPILELYAIALFIVFIFGEDQIIYEQGLSFFIAVVFPISWTMTLSNQINLFPNLTVNDQGIRVRIFNFIFVWKFIPWTQVKKVEKSPKKFRGQDIWLISIDTNLSIWHKLLNRKYGLGEDPYIFVSSDLVDINDLVADIAAAIGKDVGKTTTPNVISMA